MSKKLESILNTMPHATAAKRTEPRMQMQPPQKADASKLEVPTVMPVDEKQERIVAIIPYSLKREIKQYLVDHPGETEKTVLLKGLKSLGFSVSEAYLSDLRGKKQ